MYSVLLNLKHYYLIYKYYIFIRFRSRFYEIGIVNHTQRYKMFFLPDDLKFTTNPIKKEEIVKKNNQSSNNNSSNKTK